MPEIIALPSSALSGDELGRWFRFVHIDGSHLFDEVRADIELVREILMAGGVVAFDDVFASHAPGVAAAVWEACAGSDLTPLCVSGKLYAMWEGQPDDFVDRLRIVGAAEPLVSFESARVYDREILWTLRREPRWRDRRCGVPAWCEAVGEGCGPRGRWFGERCPASGAARLRVAGVTADQIAASSQ